MSIKLFGSQITYSKKIPNPNFLEFYNYLDGNAVHGDGELDLGRLVAFRLLQLLTELQLLDALYQVSLSIIKYH